MTKRTPIQKRARDIQREKGVPYMVALREAQGERVSVADRARAAYFTGDEEGSVWVSCGESGCISSDEVNGKTLGEVASMVQQHIREKHNEEEGEDGQDEEEQDAPSVAGPRGRRDGGGSGTHQQRG